MAGYYGALAAELESDDESQVSYVDPADVAKCVEGMDDLDADLFTSSRKTNKSHVSAAGPSPKKSALKSTSDEKRSKSRVSFDSPNKVSPASMTSLGRKSFDEADPLADLLSDEDSLGSKKEADKLSVTNPVQPVSLATPHSSVGAAVPRTGAAKQDKSKVISDLFGLGSDDARTEPPAVLSLTGRDEENKSSSKHSSDWLGISSPTKAPTATVVQRAIPQSKVNVSIKTPISPQKTRHDTKSEDFSDDLLGKMGFSDRKVSELLDTSADKLGTGSSKPKSLMDDLFRKSVSSTSKENVVGISNSPEKKMDTKDVSQDGNPVSFGSYAPSISTVREPRRAASRHTSSLADPLGLFSASQAIGQERTTESGSVVTAPTNKLDLTPSETNYQLGASSKSSGMMQLQSSRDSGVAAVTKELAPPSQQLGSLATSTANLPEWLGGGASVMEKPVTQVGHVQESSMDVTAEGTDTAHLEVDNDERLGLSLLAGARFNQELVASLQRQEAQLVAALQAKQHQDQMVNLHWRQQEVLQRQERQLQDLVERQVERQRQVENQLIRQQERIASHIQALISQPVVLPAPEIPVVGPTGVAVVQSSQTSDVGADRSHIIQPQHDSPAACSDADVRYREELERVEGFYKHHIASLESSLERLEVRLRAENLRLEEEYQARVVKLQEELRLLEDAHKQKVAVLQEERLADLKHLKELYQREVDDLSQHYARVVAIEQDNSLQTRSLQLLCEQLGQSSAQLISLEGKMDGRQHSELDVRDAALRAKEVELKAAREALERQQVVCEEERKRLVGLVADLELRAAERQAEVDARAWELRQEAAKLDARTQALEGERQRSQTQLEHERRQVQQLKQCVLEEQKRMNQQLREEQLKLSAEKSRLEAVARLQGPPAPAIMADVEEVRAKAEAAMQVALDSAQMAEVEREKLAEQKRQLAAEHRRLRDKEKELVVRSQELDILGEVAAATKDEGLRALNECRDLQQQHAARTAELQRQVSQLKERERRLAEEKVALSRERQALQKSRDQDRFCSFCRMLLENSGSSAPASMKPSQKHYVDPEQVILRLAGERDQDDNSHSIFPSSLISK